VIHATFPLARADDAHRLMESSQHIGKIVLEV
jgi:NADPH:quinone reductase-like Zn-dependent oxidoreductase